MTAQTPAPPAGRAETKSKFDVRVLLAVAPFLVVWAVYLGLRTGMPDDALAPFRNGLYWPEGEEFLLEKGGGIVTGVLLHVGFTYGLGLALLIVPFLVLSALKKGERAVRFLVLPCFAIAFVAMFSLVVVPDRITRIDEERGEIVTTRKVSVAPWLAWEESLDIEDVRALGVRRGVRGTKSKEQVVRLFALPEKGEPLELGEAACAGEAEACLAWADPAVALFAKRLGWKGKPRVSKADDGALRKYEPGGARD